ncbi:MAG TPA: POTRA domain-containing protein [Blastocatellia bacterium]|nr:POTRA domain-containing protein [Blastocatellia bacterium]
MENAGTRLHSFTQAVRFTFLFLLLVLSPVAQAQNFESYTGKPIAALRVILETDRQSEAGEDLRTLLRMRQGGMWALADVRRTLQALYESGRVANARVETQANADGTVAVTFYVTPQVRVGEVDFKGLFDVGEDELRGRLAELERGAKFSDTVVQKGAEQIYEALKERGYYQVSVEPKVTYDTARTVARIVYNISMGSQATIGEIRFTGTQKISENTLRAAMLSRVGYPFSQPQLNADVQKLLGLHLAQQYLDARIGPADLTYDNAANKVSVVLPVNSGPKFTIRVEGHSFSDKKLHQLLPLLREGGVNSASLEESARRLRENLQEEGFFFAEVTPPEVPDLTADRAELVFSAEPGQRYRVTEIQIEGTNNLTYADVADELRTKTESFIPLPILTQYTRGITSEQALRRDVELLLARLRDLGFRRARRVSINRAVSPDNDKLKIVFTLEEGPRSWISDITFRGNTLVDSDVLRSQIDLKEGEPYSLSRVKTEGNRILQYYFDRGYASATVTARAAELAADENGERVRVIYEITEGPLVFINRVLINPIGLRRRTKDSRVRRYLTFTDGERLNNDKLARSEQELYATGAFRRVQMRTEPLGEENSLGEVRRNVIVDVEEGKSRSIVYGGGYQSDEGPRGIFEVSDPNIFGSLTTVSLRFRGSTRNLLGQFSYTDQRPLGSTMPVLFSLLAQREDREAFIARRGTALVQAERRLSERALLLFRYNYETVRISDKTCAQQSGNSNTVCVPTSNGQLDRRDAPIRLSRVSASFAFDGRDNPFDAKTGRYNTVDFSFAARALGGNEQFLRFFTENQAYYTVPRSGGVVLAGDVRIGLARNVGGSSGPLLPISERFFSGGSTTLRGYGFEQAGPRDYQLMDRLDDKGQPVKDANGQIIQDAVSRPLGGNALVVINAEIRRNVYRQFGLVGFYDAGNVFSLVSDIGFNRFSHTIGAGIRIRTPLGPVRLDLGYLVSDPYVNSGLNSQQKAAISIPRFRIHFSFGQAF